jgi:spore maturation protein SpmB
MDVLKRWTEPVTGLIGMDPQLLPVAIMRPLSGSGARGFMLEIWQSSGADSLVGLTASVMQGSTETTFYILAVYCGCVGVRRIRYSLGACLPADVAGLIAAVLVSNWFFGHLFE